MRTVLQNASTLLKENNNRKPQFTATKETIDQDPQKALELFVQEKIQMPYQSEAHEQSEFATSLTSLVLRLPAYDYI